jgi:hypothetical protein
MLEIELCLGKDMFVLAHPHGLSFYIDGDGIAANIMTKSFYTICETLEGSLRDETLYRLYYGMHKWETQSLPGTITAFTRTWDFNSKDAEVEQGKELIKPKIYRAT